MGRILFTADLHFCDDAIRRYENRPFENTKEMDEYLIRHWNISVNPQDTVYILGDFGAEGHEHKMLMHMTGTKYLVKGNHDTQTNKNYRHAGFKEVYDHPIILDGFWILSHEPVYVNEHMPYANIFGHVHRSSIFRDFSSQHYCVSYDRLGKIAIDFEDIKTAIKSEQEKETT